MRLESRKLLWDALDAVTTVARLVDGRTYDDYMADAALPSAVAWQLVVLGEALAQLRRLDPEAAARIDDLPRIVAFRNVLIRAYGSVDHTVVWTVIETELSSLQARLGQLLAEDVG